MLLIGHLRPRKEEWTFHKQELVDLTPWRFSIPCATTLFSCVVGLYLLFSPIGLVNGLSPVFWPLVLVLLIGNFLVWAHYIRKGSVLAPRMTMSHDSHEVQDQ